jgi:hypothetical protein
MCSGLFLTPKFISSTLPAPDHPIQNFSTHFMSVTLHFLLLLISSVGGGQSLEGGRSYNGALSTELYNRLLGEGMYLY